MIYSLSCNSRCTFCVALFFPPPIFGTRPNRKTVLPEGCHYGASLARTQQTLQNIIFRGVSMRGIISFITGALCACAGVIVTCAVSASAREWVIHILGGGA